MKRKATFNSSLTYMKIDPKTSLIDSYTHDNKEINSYVHLYQPFLFLWFLDTSPSVTVFLLMHVYASHKYIQTFIYFKHYPYFLQFWVFFFFFFFACLNWICTYSYMVFFLPQNVLWCVLTCTIIDIISFVFLNCTYNIM